MEIKSLIKKFTPDFLLDSYHYLLALGGAFFYGFPSKKIKVIGVTGTNGKTTVVEMIIRILKEAGYKTASLSSISFRINDKEWPNTLKMTMPGRFKIQKFLRKAVNEGCQYMVLEVTSEGIKQHRHRFIDFEAAVLTNLTLEHIEAHSGFGNYKKAKLKLFQAAKNIHIINCDDENAEYFLKVPAKEKICYGMDPKPAIKDFRSIKANDSKTSSEGIDFTVENTEFHLNLLGGFNISNALAAISLGLSQGIDLETSKKALEKIKGIQGRMEEVISKPFKVFVDYAFTPNALDKVYQTVKNNFNPPEMVCVLGACGGGRDKWKRPVLGKIAAKHCGKIIITNEDPYDEDPMEILSMVKFGISETNFKMENFYEILDRREAIKKALILAEDNDAVIITGKGCEPWMCLAGGKKIPWDEQKTVKEEFGKLQTFKNE